MKMMQLIKNSPGQGKIIIKLQLFIHKVKTTNLVLVKNPSFQFPSTYNNSKIGIVKP